MKYFLALFYITSLSFAFGMDSSVKQLDEITQQVLKHYLKVSKQDKLNEDGINIAVHESKTNDHVTLYVQVEDDSTHPLAELLRDTANNSPKASHTKCTGSPDVVHRSNEDYKRATLEVGVCNVFATSKFTREEFERICKELSQ